MITGLYFNEKKKKNFSEYLFKPTPSSLLMPGLLASQNRSHVDISWRYRNQENLKKKKFFSKKNKEKYLDCCRPDKLSVIL